MLGNLGLPELLVILLIVLVIFGAGKIPHIGRGIGEGVKNFRDAMRPGPETEEKKELPPPR